MLALIRDLQKERGSTFVVVTHDPGVAKLGDREIHLRDGKLVP